jgi:predicted signal transduction protein with EAL and GGDEF domain
MNDKQRNTWVYGVVPAGSSLDELEHRGGLPEVWVVEAGDLAAIVGKPPAEDAKATRDQALAHARVLEAAIVDAPVVPLRFGIMVPGGDEQVGSDLLEARHDELAKVLKKFEDRVQMTLKVTYDENAVLREIIENEAEISQLREQSRQGPEDATRDARVRLGELISIALEQRRGRDKADIFERLKPVSVAAVDEAIETEFMVLNAPFLVERNRVEEFEEAVEQVAEERRERMQVALLGPMPAFNFLEVAEPAWA